MVPSLGSPPWTPPHSSVGLSLCSCSIDQNCIIVCYESLETWLFPSLHWECFKNRDHDLFIFAHQVPKAWYFTLHSTKYTWQVFQYFNVTCPFFRMMHRCVSAPSCCTFILKAAFQEVSEHRILIKSGPGNWWLPVSDVKYSVPLEPQSRVKEILNLLTTFIS